MKYKYTFLKNRLFYDEILIPYLDKMSKKGWNLVSVNSFFKFEKSSQVYKYQVDYNPLTDDYLETLDHLGYEHVCCMQDMHIYRNVNLDAEDLSSDEDVLCEAKLKMFKPWAIAMCILAAMIFYGFTSFFSWLYRFSWGSIFLNLDVCFSLFLIYVGCFLWLFAALFIYLKRRALKKRTYSYQKFNYLDGFVRIVIDILAILMIGMLFVLKMNNLSSLLSFSGYFILITLFATIINTKIPLIKNPIKKKIAVIVSVAVFVGVNFLYNEIDFSKLDKQEMTITLPKNKRIDENNSNLLVDTTTFIQKIGKDKDDGEAIYSFEGYYQCLNTFVSKNIFKELVLERERQTRMPSDKEIDQIVEEKGSWRSDEIGYNTYQNVLKKFKKRKSMYFDQVVEIGRYQLGIKGKKVLVVYDEDIDDFYHHYINFIQK